MRDYTEYRGSISENEKKIWNKGSTVNLEFSDENIEGYKKEILKNLILKNINMKDKIKILDIETGNGFFAMIMGEEGHNVTAIDSDSSVLKQAKHNIKNNKVKVKFKTMHKSSLDFKDKSFDLIISKNINWDLQSPKASFIEWNRVLKDNGVLVYFDSNRSTDPSENHRPNLDKDILTKSGFSKISIDQNIYKKLFSENGIIPYNSKSIFMVVAKK